MTAGVPHVHGATAWALALALSLGHPYTARSQPVPVFLPGHAPADLPADQPDPVDRKDGRKKDPRVTDRAPALRPTLCTMVNVHTSEALALDTAPAVDEDAQMARLLRDRSTWEEHAIAPGCLVTLRRAVVSFHAQRVEVVSGYRSDKLNEHLRKKGHHVAGHSQHVLGHAMDFRLVGVATPALLRFLREIHQGGIGYYPQSGFVHVDTGPRRQWSGE